MIFFPSWQGDCDDDSDCAGDLKCFKRSNGEDVPGCVGNTNAHAGSSRDYCYVDPEETTKPTFLPTVSSNNPNTFNKTFSPSLSPVTSSPTTSDPTVSPSESPVTSSPSKKPTAVPTVSPTDEPTPEVCLLLIISCCSCFWMFECHDLTQIPLLLLLPLLLSTLFPRPA